MEISEQLKVCARGQTVNCVYMKNEFMGIQVLDHWSAAFVKWTYLSVF